MSSGLTTIGRCAYEADLHVAAVLALVHVGVHVPDDRVRDLPDVPSNRAMGPTLIIWCTTGVSGIRAPAMAAMRGLHTPQQTAQTPVWMSPWVVRTARTRRPPPGPSPVVDAEHLRAASTRSAPACWPARA